MKYLMTTVIKLWKTMNQKYEEKLQTKTSNMLEACSSMTKVTILQQNLQMQHQKPELQGKKASCVDHFLLR